MLIHVFKGKEWIAERSSLRLQLQLTISFPVLKKLTHPPLEQYCILPEPGQPGAQRSQLIRPTACRNTQRTISRWYRTVNNPQWVASNDKHKQALAEFWSPSNMVYHANIYGIRFISYLQLYYSYFINPDTVSASLTCVKPPADTASKQLSCWARASTARMPQRLAAGISISNNDTHHIKKTHIVIHTMLWMNPFH